jgi:hypothetical protein
MKKIAISLVALAAVSTVAFAGENRGYDLRDSDTYFGKYATRDKAPNADAFALAVMDGQDGQALSAFERMKMLSEENDHGRQ